MTRHYLDHASTSPLRPEARAAIEVLLDGPAGDPGRVHTEGAMVRAAVEDARDRVAASIGVAPRQVIFTSGGTEAVHTAAWGALWGRPGATAMVAGVEHSSVRAASARLATVIEPAVDHLGRIDPQAIETAVRSAAGPVHLVHCQWANHEVGTVQPLQAVVELAHAAGALVHSDAAIAFGHIPLRLDGTALGELGDAGPDLVSVSAHKMGGPPGIGALIIRRGLRIEPLLTGSPQERGRRAGMENVLGIVGFGAAAEAAAERADCEQSEARRFTDRLAAIACAVDGVKQVGDPIDRVPHIVCLVVTGIEAEPVLLGLDRAGIAVHSGSACASESLEPSPVLAAMGADADHSLRLSTGWSTTDADVEAFERAWQPVIEQLRALATSQ